MDAFSHLLGRDSGKLTAWVVPIVVILAVVLYRMLRASTEIRARAEGAIKANPGPSVTVKRFARESVSVRLNKDDVEKARGLLRAGADLESVCRELEPQYPNWRGVQQQAFRDAIEMFLKAEPTAENSPQMTSTKPS
jgi:hypothetical protein